jgi:hypothetical protein
MSERDNVDDSWCGFRKRNELAALADEERESIDYGQGVERKEREEE